MINGGNTLTIDDSVHTLTGGTTPTVVALSAVGETSMSVEPSAPAITALALAGSGTNYVTARTSGRMTGGHRLVEPCHPAAGPRAAGTIGLESSDSVLTLADGTQRRGGRGWLEALTGGTGADHVALGTLVTGLAVDLAGGDDASPWPTAPTR